MSPTNPQIKTRADDLAATLSGTGAVVSKVENTTTSVIAPVVNATFTTIAVTSSLLTAVDGLSAHAGILETAITEVQKAIVIPKPKWQVGLCIFVNGSEGTLPPSFTDTHLNLLLGGVVVDTVMYTIQPPSVDTPQTVVFEYEKTVEFDAIQFTGTSSHLGFIPGTWEPTVGYWRYTGGSGITTSTPANDVGLNVNPVFGLLSSWLTRWCAQTVQ